MSLSCHILDTTTGLPAADVQCTLSIPSTAQTVGTLSTNSDGRIKWTEITLHPGVYQMRFHTAPYFEKAQRETFFPYVDIVFKVTDSTHYHIPLLLSNYGYSTYRGS